MSRLSTRLTVPSTLYICCTVERDVQAEYARLPGPHALCDQLGPVKSLGVVHVAGQS